MIIGDTTTTHVSLGYGLSNSSALVHSDPEGRGGDIPARGVVVQIQHCDQNRASHLFGRAASVGCRHYQLVTGTKTTGFCQNYEEISFNLKQAVNS